MRDGSSIRRSVPRETVAPDPLARVLAEVAVAVVLRRREAEQQRAKITLVGARRKGGNAA